MKPNLSVEIAGIKMKNPVMTASGTFGSGREYANFIDLNRLGAIVVKSITLREVKGNPTPRICETASGILNSIGLQNKGVDHFIKEDLPFLQRFNIPIVVSVAGYSIGEYVELVTRLEKAKGISAIELNVSCPNIRQGGIEFGSSSKLLGRLIRKVRSETNRPLITKLSPNIVDIVEIASTAVKEGTDALSLINSVPAMAFDIYSFKPKLANITGGLSGPAIKPIAIRLVWQVARAVKVPVIGMGGIMGAEDAIEFFLAGASAVAVGTANFINPKITIDIVDGLYNYLKEQKIKDIEELKRKFVA